MNTRQKRKIMRQRRDEKARPHLEQYAPVWLVDEVFIDEKDLLQFDVVFYHSRYGWVNRRYQFDTFNSVLYHRGQTTISEDEALALEDKAPYISAEAINTVDSYGG
jgi:hypothetical protein